MYTANLAAINLAVIRGIDPLMTASTFDYRRFLIAKLKSLEVVAIREHRIRQNIALFSCMNN